MKRRGNSEWWLSQTVAKIRAGLSVYMDVEKRGATASEEILTVVLSRPPGGH
jgi:hypothetical protein